MDIDENEMISQSKTSQVLSAFLYNKSYNQHGGVLVPTPSVGENSPPTIRMFHALKLNFSPHWTVGNIASAILNSSNGLVLTFVTYLLKNSTTTKPCAYYLVQNPITSQILGYIPTHKNTILAYPKRFCVYGFVFDPHSPRLSFTIVEVSDTSSPRPGSLLVNKFRSLDTSRCWRPKGVHNGDDLVPLLGENYVFLGSSIYLHGALHWLLDPSGVIAYYLEADCFKFSLIDIPGDKQQLNEFGLCNCITRITHECNKSSGTSTRGVCNCRFLGECGDKLVYARVSSDSEFSVWILEDYHAAVWSNCHRVRVNNLEASLFGGRVLAFSKTNAHQVFLRVEDSIFSYDYMTGNLELIGTMNKTYKGDDKWDGFVVPLELPIVPLAFRKEDYVRVAASDPAGNFLIMNGQQNFCYQHYAVTELAVQVLGDHLQQDCDKMVGELPFRSSVFLYGNDNITYGYSVRDRYSELIRTEAALYGSMGRLLSTDSSQVSSSDQLSQTPQSS